LPIDLRNSVLLVERLNLQFIMDLCLFFVSDYMHEAQVFAAAVGYYRWYTNWAPFVNILVCVCSYKATLF
jgi:hypothetical protein